MKKLETISFFTICLLGVGVVFYQFGQIPKHLSYDEIEFAQLALSLGKNSYQVYSPLATGHSTLYFYILFLAFKIFGVSTMALRLPAAIFGVANVILFYILNRLLWKNSLSVFIVSFIFLSMRWYLNFARFGFEATFLLFLELTSLVCLVVFLKNKLLRYLFISAFSAGLAFHSYQPGRIFFLLPLGVLVFKRRFRLFFLYLLTVLLVTSPLLLYLAKNPDLRINEVSLLTNTHLSVFQKIGQLAQNIEKNVGMIFFKGDMNGRHNFPGKPALNPIWGVLFLIGLAWRIVKNKTTPTFIFLLYLLISFIPSLLTRSSENPNMLRTFTATAPVAFFISAPLITFLTKGSTKRVLKLIVIALFILIPVLYELRTYFVFQSRVMKNSFEITCPLQEVVSYQRSAISKKCRVSKNLF